MEHVSFRGTVEKISTFSSKGGGIELKVQTPHESEIGATLMDNVQRPATIEIRFDEPYEDEEEEDQLELGD
ncbi:MAG: hypothetical protein ACOCSK_00270 [Rhodothermales bacterium]